MRRDVAPYDLPSIIVISHPNTKLFFHLARRISQKTTSLEGKRMSSYAPRILLFPIAEKHIAINKAQCQWHGLCSNLLRTIDKGLFVYAILYLRDGDIDYFPEPKIISVFLCFLKPSISNECSCIIIPPYLIIHFTIVQNIYFIYTFFIMSLH